MLPSIFLQKSIADLPQSSNRGEARYRIEIELYDAVSYHPELRSYKYQCSQGGLDFVEMCRVFEELHGINHEAKALPRKWLCY